jgi:hypothetical protein
MAVERDILARKSTLAEQGQEEDYLRYTQAERFALVWPLTINAWAMKGEDVSQQRLPRDVDCVKRRGG